jgi:hypothetical protein
VLVASSACGQLLRCVWLLPTLEQSCACQLLVLLPWLLVLLLLLMPKLLGVFLPLLSRLGVLGIVCLPLPASAAAAVAAA